MSVNSHFAARGGRTDLAAYSLSIHQHEPSGSSLPKPTGREHPKDFFQKPSVIPVGRNASAHYSTQQEFNPLTSIPSANHGHVLPPIFPLIQSPTFAAPSISVDQPVKSEIFAADQYALTPPYNSYPSPSCESLGSPSGLSSSYTQLDSSPLSPISLPSRTNFSSHENTSRQVATHTFAKPKINYHTHDLSSSHLTSSHKSYGPNVTVTQLADGYGHAFSSNSASRDQPAVKQYIGSEHSTLSFTTSETSSREHSASTAAHSVPPIAQSPDKKHKCE